MVAKLHSDTLSQGGVFIIVIPNFEAIDQFVMSHNINSATSMKFQHLFDVAAGINSAATMIMCVKEMKLASLTAPIGYTAVHSVQRKRQGGGITMLVA